MGWNWKSELREFLGDMLTAVVLILVAIAIMVWL